MDIYLIRHSAVDIEKGTCYGQTNVPLAADFADHFKLIGSKLDNIKPEVVYSSPASRCLQLACHFSPKVRKDKRLMELHFGEWENKKWNDLAVERLKDWGENYVEQAPPGGESYQELYKRTNAFWQEEIWPTEAQTIFIITHGGPIRSLLAYLLEMPLEKSFSLQIDLGSVSKIRLSEGFSLIEYINR